jgi:hypothetical protein
MKKILLTGALALGTLVAASGCLSTDGEGNTTLKGLEEMTELEYSRMSTYVSLGTKIGASRLLEAGQVDAETLSLVADAIEGLVGEPLLELAGGWVTDAVSSQVPLTSDELLLILIIVEQEVLTRGGGTYVDGETGELRLTERTEDLLLLVASSLRAAGGGVAPEEQSEFDALEQSPPTVSGNSMLLQPQ